MSAGGRPPPARRPASPSQGPVDDATVSLVPDPTPSATSPFVAEIAPIDCADDEIRRLLADAELQPLLPALAYATGDMSLLRDDLRPDPLLLALPAGGFTDEQAATIRDLALETLIALPRRRLRRRLPRRPTPTCCAS